MFVCVCARVCLQTGHCSTGWSPPTFSSDQLNTQSWCPFVLPLASCHNRNWQANCFSDIWPIQSRGSPKQPGCLARNRVPKWTVSKFWAPLQIPTTGYHVLAAGSSEMLRLQGKLGYLHLRNRSLPTTGPIWPQILRVNQACSATKPW